MDTKISALYHVLVLFVVSLGVFSFKRFNLIVLLFMIPVLGEIVQFFLPGRTPEFIDVLHGYLGILGGYCFVQMCREIKPVAKKVQFHLRKKTAKRHWGQNLSKRRR